MGGDTICSNLFCEFVFDSNLMQLVYVPTHVRGNIKTNAMLQFIPKVRLRRTKIFEYIKFLKEGSRIPSTVS